jgi:hypothetical protein
MTNNGKKLINADERGDKDSLSRKTRVFRN